MTDTDKIEHEELVEQAEIVLQTTRASLYDVASGHAFRLQEMLDEELEED